jgi:MFS family permease
VTEIVPADDRPNAVALYSAIVNASRIFGPALAGVLVVTVGYGWCFAVDAASYVFVLIALWMMLPSELHRVVSPDKAKGAVRTAVRYIARTPSPRIAFIVLMVIGTLGYNLNVELPLFVERSLHDGDSAFTFLYTIFSVGARASALVVAHRQLVHLRNVLIGGAAFGVALVLLAATPGLAVAVPVLLALGVTSILYFTATTAIVQVDADPSLHGRILALQTVLLVAPRRSVVRSMAPSPMLSERAPRSSSVGSPRSPPRPGVCLRPGAPTRCTDPQFRRPSVRHRTVKRVTRFAGRVRTGSTRLRAGP